MNFGDLCKCPRCGLDRARQVSIDVDIGVGTLTHVFGWECLSCGPIAACNTCGEAEPNHSDLCGHMLDLPDDDDLCLWLKESS